MAKCLVRNVIGDRTFGFLVSADSATAKGFCENFLDGTFEIFENVAKSGSPVEALVNKVTLTGKSNDGRKATFSFYAKSNLNEDELRAAVLNKTFNQVEFDEVYIISMSQIKIGA